MEAEERASKVQKRENDIDVTLSLACTQDDIVNESEHAHREPAENDQLARSPSVKDDGPVTQAVKEDTIAQDDELKQQQLDSGVNVVDLTASASLSKNQLKKLQRRQHWEESRAARKAHKKEKLVAKKDRLRRAKSDQTKSRAQNEGPCEAVTSELVGAQAEATKGDIKDAREHKPEWKNKKHIHPIRLPITLILDCSFDDLMTDKERISLASQLTRCYADNRAALYRTFLLVSSFGGGLKARFETVLGNSHRGWKGVQFEEVDYIAVLDNAIERMKGEKHRSLQPDILKGGAASFIVSDTDAVHTVTEVSIDQDEREIIYLTSDSPNTLTKLSAGGIYIIGGLVDRNRHKGICYKRAMDRGIKTAKLPIGEYLEMSSRFVLTTNQVVEIMLRWLELGDWGEAFVRVVPKRKGGVLKEGVDSAGEAPIKMLD